MPHPSARFDAHRALQISCNVDNGAALSHPVTAAFALVVEPEIHEASSIVAVLTACRFDVAVADSFTKAKAHMSARPPAVLVTELRLAEYNGLHLVVGGKSLRPDMAAVVMSRVADPVLQADAEAMGATFVLKPVDPKELRAAVVRTVCNKAIAGSPPEPVRPPFERRSDERRLASRPPTSQQDPDRRSADRRLDPFLLLGTRRA